MDRRDEAGGEAEERKSAEAEEKQRKDREARIGEGEKFEEPNKMWHVAPKDILADYSQIYRRYVQENMGWGQQVVGGEGRRGSGLRCASPEVSPVRFLIKINDNFCKHHISEYLRP
ncbi:predicted protein [Arabidopsis lyrata subsp. lyrata]|uniref:Predicted protein n=1 Tax=Arabidopsis lyrata subsp. lyrata TaxID=81972 RepID=D7MT89_ARALL|nr:predicted protein [Arabidopsis lyrata subsp. lyrata]